MKKKLFILKLINDIYFIFKNDIFLFFCFLTFVFIIQTQVYVRPIVGTRECPLCLYLKRFDILIYYLKDLKYCKSTYDICKSSLDA